MNDAWLEAVCDWTEEVLGVGWTVYRNEWPATPAEPSVMWMIGGADSLPRGSAMIEVRKFMKAFLIGSVTDRTTASMTIVAKVRQTGSVETTDTSAPSIRLTACKADLTGGSSTEHLQLTTVGIVQDLSAGSGGPLIGGIVQQAQLE